MSLTREHIIWAYRLLLEREPESEEVVELSLRSAKSIRELRLSLLKSAEFVARNKSAATGASSFPERELPNLSALYPDKYKWSEMIGSPERALSFSASREEDYDWLERMIIEHGYYDGPGVWSLVIDRDKEVTAEIIVRLGGKTALELGCASGPVLKLLQEAGVDAEGVEISHMALALAYPEVRNKIHFGDLLDLELPPKYDTIVGMDIFEHLNPNRIDAYISRCVKLLVPGGILFTNIPAFGRDNIFGEVFPLYLKQWEAEALDGGLFSTLHVDERGWPRNGHLIWATAQWWQRRFEDAGLCRAPEIERPIHDLYDSFYARSAPARRSFFAFVKPE